MSKGKQLAVVGFVILVIAGIGAVDSTSLSPGDQIENSTGDSTPLSPGSQTENSILASCAASSPGEFDDPDSGESAIGWVDGYWYDEPLEINRTDGLNQTELEELSARTAARFEALRCLNADEGLPPVEILTREQFQDEQSAQFENVSTSQATFDNAQLSTLLLVSDSEDAIEQREKNRGATVGGSYDTREDKIRIVTDDPESLQINEAVLAHELGHAIQDQQFNLSQYNRNTSDRNNGMLGLIEGDVQLIQNRYRSACEAGTWTCSNGGDSAGENGTASSGAQAPANWGLYFNSFQPYSDGPSFVQHIYDTGGGWDAVNDLYSDPPQSAYYIVAPDTFGTLDLANVTVPDESSGQWQRLTAGNQSNYDTVGVSGISAMFMTPTYESGGEVTIYNPQDILNIDSSGEVNRTDPLEYLHPETEGWRDDKLYVYRNTETNETATVWRIEWATAADSEPFVESYQEMIEYRGGEAVDGRERTYEFGEESEYDMAVRIETTGEQVTVVTAPTVEQLDDIHGEDTS